MKPGDLVYAKHPRKAGLSDKMGIILKKTKNYKIGYRYLVYFQDVPPVWIRFDCNLIPFEDIWV